MQTNEISIVIKHGFLTAEIDSIEKQGNECVVFCTVNMELNYSAPLTLWNETNTITLDESLHQQLMLFALECMEKAREIVFGISQSIGIVDEVAETIISESRARKGVINRETGEFQETF